MSNSSPKSLFESDDRAVSENDYLQEDKLSPELTEALLVMRPMVRWMLLNGINYRNFAVSLKTVFFDVAMEELKASGRKTTDSSVSLFSGLHRKDVNFIREAKTKQEPVIRNKITPSQQVITRWLNMELPEAIPFTGDEEPTFEGLAKSVSCDVHPRALCDELVRLDVVVLEGETVKLRREAFVPDATTAAARHLLAESVADHLSAGVHNLTSGSGRKFLEQSVFADGLSPESIAELESLANKIWSSALKQMVRAAEARCQKDEKEGHQHRLRLGIFCFTE